MTMVSSAATLGAHVVADNELDISIDRVDKLDSPLLVIGLGGTGAKAVHTIKRTFAQRFTLPVDANGQPIPVPRKTAYLVIDCDTTSKGNMENHEYRDITVTGLAQILNPRQRGTQSWENEWLNDNLDAISDGTGAGTYRQAARLMLSRHYNDVLSDITGKLTLISQVDHGAPGVNGTVNIVIVCGISGGTGSGTFLDVAQIVRHIMQTNAALNGYRFKITGFLVMPDVSCQALPAGSPLLNAFKANAYAALKELDFWMGYGSKHRTTYTMQYSGAAGSRIGWVKPFEACALLSGTTYHGTAYTHADQVVFNTIAENLLNYMANENNGVDPATGLPQHTYISHENNLKAAVDNMEKHLPVNYVYRSIGAYTKKIPKKSIIYYESNKLFQTFMPLRDATGNIIPSMTLINLGQCVQDAATIVEAPSAIYKRFAGDLLLPGFCSYDVNNNTDVASLCNMGIAPHDSVNDGRAPWQNSVLRPAARQRAEDFLNQIWTSFMADIRNKISNPKIGPFALKEYLDPAQEQSLRSAFQSKLAEWVGLRGNFQGSVANLYIACTNTWSQFVNPPFMGARRARQEYMDNLRRYFDMLRCAAFMEAHVSALEKFVQRVDDYRNTSLVQLCRAMDELDREFAEGGIANTVTASDLFDLASIQPQLDANFAAKNANDEIGRDFLTQLADVSFAAVPNPNPFSGGLSFTFASTRLSSIRAALREQLEDCFGNVNNASMDDILEQQVGTDPALQHAAMDALGAAIRGSADPLFSINPAMTGIHGAEFTYLSIPEDSQNYFDYFTQTFNDVTPKSSSLLDHIFCLTTYDGMPACLYSQMDDIEQVYANSLTNAAQSMGRHLVWSGDLNDDVTRNWTKLPSPRPYFLFGPTGQLSEQKKFEAALATLDRAIACGMISIDDSSPNPSYTVRMKYTTGGVAVVRTSALIRSEVDAIDAMKDPATQMALTETQKLPHLQQYQSDVTENVIVDTCNAVCMAQYLGLTDQPTDPFAKGIEANPVVMEQAKRNHHNLCHALVAAYLYSDPVTWLSIDNQLEGMEYLQERINTIVAQQNRWQIRETSAPQVAELLIHKYITIDTGKAMYDMNGQNFSLYTPQLMKVDVKGLSDYAKCAAYFGDLPAGNPARTHLENMLNLKNLQLDDAILNGTINPMKPAIHAAADGLLQKLDNEIGKYRSALMQPNADRELIANILNVLTAMKSTAETIKHNYRPATPPSGNPSPV